MERSKTTLNLDGGGDNTETQNLNNENVNQPIGSSADIESSPKPKRRFLRLDFAHVSEVFNTTFYRIWMYRRRHRLLTILQLVAPVCILMLMTAYLGTILEQEERKWSHFPEIDETALHSKICGHACDGDKKGVIAYYLANNDNFGQSFEMDLKSRLAQYNIILTRVSTKDDLVREAIKYQLQGNQQRFIAGIEIDNPGDKTFGIANNYNLHFTVAMAQKTPGFTFEPTPVFFDLRRNKPKYYYQLLGIELAVCRTYYDIIKRKMGSKLTNPPQVHVQSLSYPPHSAYTLKSEYENMADEDSSGYDNRNQGIDSMLATIFVLSMVPVIFTSIEGPVTEKENGFKLYLQLMGFPRAAYWFHWILNQMIVQLVVILTQAIFIFYPWYSNTGPLVKHGNFSLTFFVLTLYNLSCLSFFSFFAAFCRRGKMATYIGILSWLLTYHVLQSHLFDFDSSFTLFMLSCLIPSGCIHWAVYIFTSANSITWDISLNFSLTQKSGFKMSDVMFMMILNFFLYFLLTLYVDNLNPGPLELGQPWNYFFESIRCRFIDPNKEVDRNVASGTDLTRKGRKKHNHNQPEGAAKTPAVEFKEISKKFYLIDGVYGIENVQFTVYAENITVLLGHKDSGKTTLMRLLCGAYAPTSGTVIVFDYNVRKYTQKVQSFLNVCMKEDMLCEYLTVMEHMTLIAKLKGVRRKDTKDECVNILKSVGLLSMQDKEMWNLANWQRRVLCVAMSLIGDAPILVLDAPTLGLDIDAKRQIWALLKDLKAEGKTILMSSQDVDEAYQVADKIVIMSRGRLAGVGVPSKLESLFETGYHLSIEIIPNADPSGILALLKKHIPTIRENEGGLKRVKSAIQVQNWDQHSSMAMSTLLGASRHNQTTISIPTEIKEAGSPSSPAVEDELVAPNLTFSYLLPVQEVPKFPALFRELDDAATALKLGIKQYDLHWHNIENAFDEIDDYVDVLKASNSSDDIKLENFVETKTKSIKMLVDEQTDKTMRTFEFVRDKKCSSCWKGLWAVIIKRCSHIIGNYRQCICQILAPIFILLITISSTNVHFSNGLTSTPISYATSTELTHPEVPYRINSNDMEANKFLDSFKRVTQTPPNNIKRFKNIGTSKFQDHYHKDTWHKLHDEVVVGADFTQVSSTPGKVIAHFSPGHHHSAPLSLLLMFNSLLDYEFGTGRKTGKTFTITMSGKSMLHGKQFSYLSGETLYDVIKNTGVDITFTVALAFGCFIFVSGFVTQPCAERLCNLKRYQMYYLNWNGLYWIANLIVDFCCTIVYVTVITLVIYYAPSHQIFKNPKFISLLVIILTLGTFGSIIASYYWSHYWRKKETSFYATLSVNQFMGLFVFLFYTIINFEVLGSYAATVVVLTLHLLRPFTVPWSLNCAVMYALEKGRCRTLHPIFIDELCSMNYNNPDSDFTNATEECCSQDWGKWKWDADFYWISSSSHTLLWIWVYIVILCCHCVAGPLLLMYMESRRRRRNLLQYRSRPEKPPALISSTDEKSIKLEETFVKEEVPRMEKEIREKWLIIDDLSTSIGNRNLLHPMSFAVEPGKCTVICGPETCGITTLYEILAGLRATSEGKVTYGGYSLLSWGTRRKFLQQLGLSPSQDVVLEKLTGQQLLELFGRLRGISPTDLRGHIDYWVHKLGLQKKIRKRCASYSVVVRRKLSIAMAVIGNPSVFIFDEPTKDLDPVSRSEVCNVIRDLICDNRVVLILTHDLASVKDLCSKLILLVNGQMQFCENTESVYNDIAEEFTLTINQKGDKKGQVDIEAFTRFVAEIESSVESITLQEEQSYTLIYRIKNIKYNWAELFETVEKIVSNHASVIQDYNIRRTSLEDVYHSYATKQRVFRKTMSAWDEFLITFF